MDFKPNEIERVLISAERIQGRVAELGQQLTSELRGTVPVFVGVLRGAAIFFADLTREVDLRLKMDFISVSSYGAATSTSGEVRMMKDLESSIEGEDIILVEDIIDTGLTIKYLLRNLQSRRPRSIRVCTLLSKPSRREVEVPVDYTGFEVPDEFVVGYGLDYNQKYRNLPFIGVLGSAEIRSQNPES